MCTLCLPSDRKPEKLPLLTLILEKILKKGQGVLCQYKAKKISVKQNIFERDKPQKLRQKRQNDQGKKNIKSSTFLYILCVYTRQKTSLKKNNLQ